MASNNDLNKQASEVYDPRWFIWTIVFLLVTGVSLVSYIVFSEPSAEAAPDITSPRVLKDRK
jgi:hypothetical protein